MEILARVLIAMVLLAVATFCVFGFMATYEPPGSPILRVAYALIGISCVIAAIFLMAGKRKS